VAINTSAALISPSGLGKVTVSNEGCAREGEVIAKDE
jgi:hypothetical protein